MYLMCVKMTRLEPDYGIYHLLSCVLCAREYNSLFIGYNIINIGMNTDTHTQLPFIEYVSLYMHIFVKVIMELEFNKT